MRKQPPVTQESLPGKTPDAQKADVPRWVGRGLTIVLVIAAAMRLWGIDYGLPYEGITYDQVTYEESQEVHRAFKLGAGEYAWVFGKGGLYFLLFVEYGIYYVVSLALGWVGDSREFAVQVLQDRTPTYLMGRLTNLLLGLLTYAVVYAIGKRLYDWRVGFAAAIIGSLAYYHAVFSTVINVDIGMTFALWTSVLVYLKYERDKGLRYLVGSGVLGAVAIAFKLPAAVLIPLIFLAIASAPGQWQVPRRVFKECGIFLVSLLASLTVIAPEWVTSVGPIIGGNLFGLLDTASAAEGDPEKLDDAIRSVSVIRHGTWTGYLQQLFSNYNLALTVSALMGAAVGVYRKHRWDLILAAFAISFVAVMSATDRSQSEHYLLPIMPALWLLGARFVLTVYSHNRHVGIACLVAIVAAPSVALVRHSVEKSHPDTRIVAKNWIEGNISPGARILMDGMQFRFIPSPPLSPNETALARQVKRATDKGGKMGRGVSQLTLEIYEEALSNAQGPTFDLYSTTHGVGLESPDYYVDSCFDYVVTSSYITKRFEPGKPRRELVPQAAVFYDALSTDTRYRQVYQVEPVAWNSIGPTITVYDVASTCGNAAAG